MTSLLRLQPGTATPPIYCFHPLGGSAGVYGALALYIGSDRLVFGLQSIGLAGGEPDRTVEAMVERYAAEIAGSGIDAYGGPAVFLGYSMGGMLALETARLLRDEVRYPPAVLLIDCDPLYGTELDSDPWRVLLDQVLDIDLPAGILTGLALPDALRLVRAAGAEQGRLPARFSIDRLGRMLRVCAANERASAQHVPAPYPGRLHVIRAAVANAEPFGDAWEAFAEEVIMWVVPAGHYAVMSPVCYPAIAGRVRGLLGGGRSAGRAPGGAVAPAQRPVGSSS
ncbi:alpha/beta fold hydrolase [Dactylosporangium sp. CA-139066]|uniref:thioesterase domain-containing protein n=1 Tax=Dactylosporangium sp. CA-139066 TaxID=3239930 RepID=UPI003D8C0A8C